MKFTKRYTPRNINFHLLPDLMEQIKTSVPESMLVEMFASGKHKVRPDQYFVIQTNSQTASTRVSEEFRDIIRSITEPILVLDADVDCFPVEDYLSSFESKPAIFQLRYRQDYIEIILARNTAENIKNHFLTIEETFSLETMKPKVEQSDERVLKRTIFLAHSFDQTGKSYAYELIKFLNLIGFQVSTGEGYSPERVSKKVKERLMTQDVVIVIVSKKENPTWLIQEAAGAAFVDKPLILLIEEDTDFKLGILGDIEYIHFLFA